MGSWTEYYEETKEEHPEHRARVKRIKTDLNRLRINELRRELCSAGLPEAGKKRDLVDRLIPHRLEVLGSPFDLLPDEIVLKILKLSAWSEFDRHHWNYWGEYSPALNYDFIIWNLCMVSARFNRVTRDPSVWKDCTQLRPDVGILGRVTKWFLHAGLVDIRVGGDYWVEDYGYPWHQPPPDYPGKPTITEDHLAAIASKCPNLKRFEVGKVNIDTWPAVCMPALEELYMLGPGCGRTMFKNTQLHLVLPRLKTLLVQMHHYQRMWLPDMTKSIHLRDVRLRGGTFHAQSYLEGAVPFPRTLEKLTCMSQSLGLTNQKIMEHFEDSDCDLSLY